MKYNYPLGWSLALLLLAGCHGNPSNPGNTDNPPNPVTPVLTDVTVTCAPATVSAGLSAQCSASARDQNGDPFSVSQYVWTSSNEAVAKVDASGKATSLAVGSLTITATATADGVMKQGLATLTVTNKAPTLHATNISAPETWHVADNPHEVKGQLSVDSSATLTLEPGVQVLFDADSQLTVSSGALQASGTSAAPILLGANAPGGAGFWRGVVLATAGSGSLLEYVRLSDCGASTGEGACLSVRNTATPVLHVVTVSGSTSAGVKVADDGSAFGATSDTLTVMQSAGYAVRLGANQAATLPGHLSLSGNTSNTVELTGNVSRTQTWPNPGVPFVVNGRVFAEGVDKSTPMTLTLSAGTTLRFGANADLFISYRAPATLVVNGTTDAPVLFTADTEVPTPGYWGGVHFFTNSNAPSSRVSHATFEYSGGTSFIDTSKGSLTINGFSDLCDHNNCPVLTDVVIQKSGSTGIHCLNEGGFGAGSARLTFRDNAQYAARMSSNSVGTFPTDNTFSGNTPNAVEIFEGIIFQTQTWANLGVPYTLTAPLTQLGTNVNRGLTNTPTLTLAPGTQVLFAKGTGLTVGFNGGQTGILMAQGTAAAPIYFGPDNAATTSYGYWRGLHFWKAAGSKMDYVTITHGGGDGDQTQGAVGLGNLNVYQEIGAFVKNSTFTWANGCAITVSDGTRSGTTAVTSNFFDSTLNNSPTHNGFNKQCSN